MAPNAANEFVIVMLQVFSINVVISEKPRA